MTLPCTPIRASGARAALRTPLRMALAVVAVATLVGGCAPLLIGGAMVGGGLVASDRRTTGAQLEDEAIELKARSRLGERMSDGAHVVATSYNRVVLLTGQVPGGADKATAERTVAGIDNVRSVVNELALSGSRSLLGRSEDTLITGRVKAGLVEARDLMANSVKVVTEDATVYLMGRVTEREAARAADIARGVGGVRKVVRVFDLLTEAELAGLPPAANSAGAAASAPAMPTAPPGEARK